MVARREGNNSSWKGDHSSQGRGCAAPAAAWEYLLMPQECGYVMASPPRALPLPPSQPPALGSIAPHEMEAEISAGGGSRLRKACNAQQLLAATVTPMFPGVPVPAMRAEGEKVLKTFSLRI